MDEVRLLHWQHSLSGYQIFSFLGRIHCCGSNVWWSHVVGRGGQREHGKQFYVAEDSWSKVSLIILALLLHFPYDLSLSYCINWNTDPLPFFLVELFHFSVVGKILYCHLLNVWISNFIVNHKWLKSCCLTTAEELTCALETMASDITREWEELTFQGIATVRPAF